MFALLQSGSVLSIELLLVIALTVAPILLVLVILLLKKFREDGEPA